MNCLKESYEPAYKVFDTCVFDNSLPEDEKNYVE
jgi:hypothetical protein